MYIFYDFETSDKDFLGQILSYSFILTDENYQIINELNGIIKPNRTELPSVGAILTNKLNINTLLSDGITEFDAADTIYAFLESIINEYGPIQLVGFNSARFDFKHFEKLLLKYGLSPTFYGKVTSLDILQFARYCALKNPNEFPFTKREKNATPYYSFKLEDLASAFNCLDTPQTHDARDDVLLTIELLKKLESECNVTLQQFQKDQHNIQPFEPTNILTEQHLEFEQPNDAPNIGNTDWIVIGKASKSTFILLNISTYQSPLDTFEDYQPITRYLNTRTTHFNCCNIAPNTHTDILKDPHIKRIQENAIRYFSLFPVDWDIEYRPWAMGFQNIDQLRHSILALNADPTQYSSIINTLLEYRTQQEKKDATNMMIQCFNRYYLNFHPNPDPNHLQKYLKPRYITHSLYRNPDDGISLSNETKEINNHLSIINASDTDHQILIALQQYQTKFKTLFS